MLVSPHLFIPGPTNVPEAVRRAMDIRQEDMRSPEFPKFTLPLFEDLKKAFKLTNGRVFIYPASGTGAWESAISNTLNTGDKVLMSRFGQFSLLWVDMRSASASTCRCWTRSGARACGREVRGDPRRR